MDKTLHITQGDQTVYLSIVAEGVEVTIESRPTYCNRGNFLAKAFSGGKEPLHLDKQDMWPRYYMSLDTALSEVTAWLSKNNQKVLSPWRRHRVKEKKS